MKPSIKFHFYEVSRTEKLIYGDRNQKDVRLF